MTFIVPDFASTLAFLAIVGFVLAAYLYATHRSYMNAAGGPWKATFIAAGVTALFLGLFSALVVGGWAAAKPMPRLPLFFAALNFSALAAALSPWGRRLAVGMPIAVLLGFQGFRLPLELVLHDWAAQGSIPGTMTWTGSNWDIVSGITALAFIPIVRKRPLSAWIPNLVGFLLLLNVMRVVAFSSPLPFAWSLNPPLLLGFHLPYAWIAPVCVGGALIGHILLTRALLAQNPSKA